MFDKQHLKKTTNGVFFWYLFFYFSETNMIFSESPTCLSSPYFLCPSLTKTLDWFGRNIYSAKQLKLRIKCETKNRWHYIHLMIIFVLVLPCCFKKCKFLSTEILLKAAFLNLFLNLQDMSSGFLNDQKKGL